MKTWELVVIERRQFRCIYRTEASTEEEADRLFGEDEARLVDEEEIDACYDGRIQSTREIDDLKGGTA